MNKPALGAFQTLAVALDSSFGGEGAVRGWFYSAIVWVLAWPGCASAQDNSVAERLAAEIRTSLPGATVTVPDPNGLDISFGGQMRSVGIGSVHAACAESTASCDAAIRMYALRAASYMLETAPLSRDQLRVVVRSRGYMESMRTQMGSIENFVSEPLIGDLISLCYRDLPQGRRPIMASDLAALQLDQSTALSACKSNSRSALAPLAAQWKPLPDQGIGIIQNGDDVTGYLVAPDEWRALAERQGGLIVAAPSVDTLLYARGTDVIGVDAFFTLAAEMHARASTPVSAGVFRWTDRGWVEAQR